MEITGERRSLKVLVAADIHQRRGKLDALLAAVSREKPAVIALNGDLLDVGANYRGQVSVRDCAARLTGLPVGELIIVRGNHEDENWLEFLAAWPLDSRRPTLLHGSTARHGPLTIVGFPCLLGNQVPFEDSLAVVDGETRPSLLDRPGEIESWLPGQLRAYGPSSRAVWLMHEPPSGTPLSERTGPVSGNLEWLEAIERFSPLLVLCGHDHNSPRRNRRWYCRIQDTVCVNVGQDGSDGLCHAVVELEFPRPTPCLPTWMVVRAHPWGESLCVLPPR